ncbi:hypothetical protein SAMN04487970_10599 [Paenibacillus tianmuensis]|uniref:Uncharacterized protein n=2 Tax=Paenibacillus tianmuensis TaxID=624147 RepID=A0A1G4TNM0_9BACL|nr:hypothetical protein SAMN04487970_10599 [Paenibacillus tianmuensis]
MDKIFLDGAESSPVAKNKGANWKVPIIIAYLITASIAATLFYMYINLQTQLSQSAAELNEIKEKVSSIDFEKIQKNQKGLQEDNMLAKLQHEIEGGVVTNDFVVQKIKLYFLDGKMSGTIDLSAQPELTVKYNGQGKFDIQDRELKGMIEDILKEVSKVYADLPLGRFPSWDKTEFKITVKNYEVATYTNSSLKLKGE